MKNSIFQRIVEAREEAGLDTTQVAIAKDLGLAQSSVHQWKEGKGLRLSHALKIAEQTNVCVEWLFTGRPPKRPIKSGSETARLLEILDRLPDEILQEVLNYAEFRAKS